MRRYQTYRGQTLIPHRRGSSSNRLKVDISISPLGRFVSPGSMFRRIFCVIRSREDRVEARLIRTNWTSMFLIPVGVTWTNCWIVFRVTIKCRVIALFLALFPLCPPSTIKTLKIERTLLFMLFQEVDFQYFLWKDLLLSVNACYLRQHQ